MFTEFRLTKCGGGGNPGGAGTPQSSCIKLDLVVVRIDGLSDIGELINI